MSDKQDRKKLHADYWRETFFLPPLKMVLAFLDKEPRQQEQTDSEVENPENVTGKDVEKLIEKLSEKEK